uniref:Uncharacterized protein n=2 Tax=Oryza glumipatula TaxID=40148 RepID=A0A0D9YCP8_9ORYZ
MARSDDEFGGHGSPPPVTNLCKSVPEDKMDVVAPVMGIGSEEMAVGMRMRRRFTPIVWNPRGSRYWTLGGGDSSGALHGRKMVQWWRSVWGGGRPDGGSKVEGGGGRCGVHEVTGRRGAWLGLGSLPPTDMDGFFLQRRFLKYWMQLAFDQ